jgi:hypothetical protein
MQLMRIDHTAARTGAGGLAGLAWVWPLSTLAALLLLARLRRQGHRR